MWRTTTLYAQLRCPPPQQPRRNHAVRRPTLRRPITFYCGSASLPLLHGATISSNDSAGMPGRRIKAVLLWSEPPVGNRCRRHSPSGENVLATCRPRLVPKRRKPTLLTTHAQRYVLSDSGARNDENDMTTSTIDRSNSYMDRRWTDLTGLFMPPDPPHNTPQYNRIRQWISRAGDQLHCH